MPAPNFLGANGSQGVAGRPLSVLALGPPLGSVRQDQEPRCSTLPPATQQCSDRREQEAGLGGVWGRASREPGEQGLLLGAPRRRGKGLEGPPSPSCLVGEALSGLV